MLDLGRYYGEIFLEFLRIVIGVVLGQDSKKFSMIPCGML